MKRLKSLKEILNYLQQPFPTQFHSIPVVEQTFATKFPMGMWRDICAPSLRGTTFRQVCVGYNDFASMKGYLLFNNF